MTKVFKCREKVEEKRLEKQKLTTELKQSNKKRKKESFQPLLNISNNSWQIEKPPLDPKIQGRWMDAVVDYAASTQISFEAVSGEHFKKLIAAIPMSSRNRVEVRSRRTVVRHVSSSAESLLNDIQRIIENEKDSLQSVCFTTDMWTSREGDCFISLTIHFVSKEFKLLRFVPFCSHFVEKHTGRNIKLRLDEMLESLGLLELPVKKFVVNDNAANAKCAIRLSDRLCQYLCKIHTLQLAINDTLSKGVCLSVGCKSVVVKAQEIAKYIKKVNIAKPQVKEACSATKIKYTSAKIPCPTRWNTRLTNMKSVQKLKPALNHLSNEDVTGVWKSKNLDPAEWKVLDGMVEVLEFPLGTTKCLEAEETPTIHLVIPKLYLLKTQLTRFSNNLRKDR